MSPFGNLSLILTIKHNTLRIFLPASLSHIHRGTIFGLVYDLGF